MRRLSLLALALMPGAAFAAADARVLITNQTPTVIVAADNSQRLVDGPTVVLQEGERVGFTFDYTLTASDDGLSFTDQQLGDYWMSATLVGPGKNPRTVDLGRHEYAVATVGAFAPCPPAGCPSWVSFSATWDTLETLADDKPQALQKSGHGEVWLTLLRGQGMPLAIVGVPTLGSDAQAFASFAPQRVQVQQVSAVPEPSSAALLGAGLAALLLTLRRRTAPRWR